MNVVEQKIHYLPTKCSGEIEIFSKYQLPVSLMINYRFLYLKQTHQSIPNFCEMWVSTFLSLTSE